MKVDEGGWYLNPSSNRGSDSMGPSLIAPGTLIRAAKANFTNEYITYTGTSMASPMIAGITEEFGQSGYDKVYGNGLILSHDTVKAAKGSTSGSYNDYRDHIRAESSISANSIDFYEISVYNTSPYFASALIINQEDSDDFDLYVWPPGVEPIQNNQLRLDLAIESSEGYLPQE